MRESKKQLNKQLILKQNKLNLLLKTEIITPEMMIEIQKLINETCDIKDKIHSRHIAIPHKDMWETDNASLKLNNKLLDRIPIIGKVNRNGDDIKWMKRK
jgi:hypothetical protein